MANPIPPELAALAATFQKIRPCVPANLALELWYAWQQLQPNSRFLTTEEDDLALILHAQAHGARVPSVGADTYEGRLLGRFRKSYLPLVPPPLPWGPRANLAANVGVALDSPVMDVWVFRDNQTLPTLLLIIGEGRPEIREQVLPAVFMATIQIGTMDTDHVNIGALRVEFPVQGRPRAWDLPVTVLDPFRTHVPMGTAEQTGREPLHDLVKDLQDLERRTGLVRVHFTSYDEYSGLFQRFQELAHDVVPDGSAVIWAPAAQAAGGEVKPGVDLLPYFRIPSGTRLRLAFSGDLLASPAYEELERTFRLATMERVKADIQIRLDYHTREERRLTRELSEYEATDPAERLAKYGPTVTIHFRYDDELGVAIRFSQPKEVPTAEFYSEEVPGQIESHRSWMARLERQAKSIENADASPTSPVRRLAISRFLDAAMRNRRPDESEPLAAAFAAWYAQVQPMLCLEWRHFLERQSIEPAHVLTGHTIFHTWVDQPKSGQWQLLSAPSSVVDREHSAVLFDPDHSVLQVVDPTDGATITTGGESDAEAKLAALRQLADEPATTQDAFDAALLEALQQAPEQVTRWLLGALTTGAVADIDSSTKADDLVKTTATAEDEPAAAFENDLYPAVEAASLNRKMRQAITAHQVDAIQSARAYLGFLDGQSGERGARVKLLLAAIEYVITGRDIKDAPGILISLLPEADIESQQLLPTSRPGVAELDHCAAALREAHRRDAAYTRQWLTRLTISGLVRGIGLLIRDLPEFVDSDAGSEQKASQRTGGSNARLRAILNTRIAAETARIARELEQATTKLAHDGEPIPTTLAKIGLQLEDTFLAEFAGGPRTSASDLLEALIGQEQQKLDEG